VDSESSSDYIALVVRLQAHADGNWYVSIGGTTTMEALPLRPISLVVRLWHSRNTGILRGNIQLSDSDRWAPIQSNDQLKELLRAWLLSDGSAIGTQ
jgi:hypothetical protein